MNPLSFAPGRTQVLAFAKALTHYGNVPPRTSLRAAPSPTPCDRRKEVFFELDASSAKEVLLAGDFTGWEKTPIKMRKGEFGAWYATVMMAPGQYHYKFVVDGRWQPDPRAAACSPNPFGSSDSVLEIS